MGIFIYARNSMRRVRTHDIAAINSGNSQQLRISRRGLSLLKQILFIFTMFIVGWSSAFAINTITATSHVDDRIQMTCIYLSEIYLICLVINLFIFNHDVRQHVLHRV